MGWIAERNVTVSTLRVVIPSLAPVAVWQDGWVSGVAKPCS